MIQKFSCPSCAAPLIFQSMYTAYITCPSCRSIVVRHGTDFELLGKVSDIIDDLTVLQPQSKGRFRDKAFTLLGRLKLQWSDGFWNEWCADTGKDLCWLSEAQGNYVFYNRFSPVKDTPQKTLKAGETYQAPDNELYEITDTRMAKIVGIEGEVPHRFKLNEEFLSIDLQKNNGLCATLEIKDTESNFSFGFAETFPNFHFEYLRKLDGW